MLRASLSAPDVFSWQIARVRKPNRGPIRTEIRTVFQASPFQVFPYLASNEGFFAGN